MVLTRNTRQKTIIENEIKSIKTFFSSEELLEKTRKKDKTIGIATIYRNLKELKNNGSIYSYKCSGKTIYSNNKNSHCHFECINTGKIIHFEIENIDFLKNKIPGDIASFQLEIKGILK